jgi:glyoxylate reductase
VLDAAGPALRVVSNYAVGYNNIDVAEAARRGVAVTNTPGVLTETTADFTWALLLAVCRRLAEGDALLRRGTPWQWAPEFMLGADVSGKTLGIVGMGRIGQAVARRAHAFNMEVVYTTRRAPAAASPEQGADQQEGERGRERCLPLDDLLRQADVVSLHVPYNQETHHLIAARELALMKHTAYLINTARGPIVDEAALVEALRAGAIAGAGLDVYEREPELTPGLAELRTTVLAPHLGSATIETRTRMATMAAENVLAVLRGERPPNLVVPGA